MAALYGLIFAFQLTEENGSVTQQTHPPPLKLSKCSSQEIKTVRDEVITG